jgi:hypothetical protein
VRANTGTPSGSRSACRIEAFDSLLSLADVSFYDLTDPVADGAASHRPANLRSLEPIAQNPGSLEWALAIAQLDLVIGVDSAAVHLAGTLGIPCWVLLGIVSDWWWPTHGDVSPWYPSARIFRQPTPGDEDELLESVRSVFRKWLTDRVRA